MGLDPGPAASGLGGICRLREPWQTHARALLAYEGEVTVASIEDRTGMTSGEIRAATIEAERLSI
jgi:hypothetical protein